MIHLQTESFDELIEIHGCSNGFYYLIWDYELGMAWGNSFLFNSPTDALAIAILSQHKERLSLIENPAAIFCPDTKRILYSNSSHWTWLGHDAVGLCCDEVLTRVISSERVATKIIPIANRIVGVYEIEQPSCKFEYPRVDVQVMDAMSRFQDYTHLYGFANLAPSSRRIVERWVALGNTIEFHKAWWADLDVLDRLQHF
jgi:hypothetical protein